MALLTGTNSTYYQGADGAFNNGDENYGNYQFITLKDIVGNFLISYVGEGKIIPRVRRQDVLFHAHEYIKKDLGGIQNIKYYVLMHPADNSLKSQFHFQKSHLVLKLHQNILLLFLF